MTSDNLKMPRYERYHAMALATQSGFRAYLRPIFQDYRWLAWDTPLRLTYLSLQIIDLALTVLAVSLGYHELNPFVRGVLSSPLHLLTIKMIIPAMIACIVPGKFLIPGILLLLFIVGWNVKELALVIF